MLWKLIRRWFGFPAPPTVRIIKGDITKVKADAIVNAANKSLLGGGGVDGAIHRAAGPGLLEECRALREWSPDLRCETGDARITSAHNLPAKFVIHAVGPVYESAGVSRLKLISAYMKSMRLASNSGAKSIALPAISCGVFGYPLNEAAPIAIESCLSAQSCVADGIEEIIFVMFDDAAYEAWNKALYETEIKYRKA